MIARLKDSIRNSESPARQEAAIERERMVIDHNCPGEYSTGRGRVDRMRGREGVDQSSVNLPPGTHMEIDERRGNQSDSDATEEAGK